MLPQMLRACARGVFRPVRFQLCRWASNSYRQSFRGMVPSTASATLKRFIMKTTDDRIAEVAAQGVKEEVECLLRARLNDSEEVPVIPVLEDMATLANNIDTETGLALMLGKTFVRAVGAVGDGDMLFETTEGGRFLFRVYERRIGDFSVTINDIVGDLEDLVGSPLLMAEEVSGYIGPELSYDASYTYTFYKFATLKGYVDVRWLGESNGYYSESVDMFVTGVSVEE